MDPIAPYRPFGAFRVLLACLVVAQHLLANCAPAWVAAPLAPYEVGSLAVLVFFALSGYVICEAADRVYRARPAAFLANRLLRIAPHYLVCLIVLVAVAGLLATMQPVRLGRQHVLDPGTAFGAGNLAANLLGFLPFAHLAMREDLIPMAWAIRIEMIFYLVVAGVMFAVATPHARRRGTGFATGAGAAGAAAAGLFLAAMLGRAPAFLQLGPYFVLGGALYLTQACRSRLAALVAVACLAGIAWEFGARPVRNPAAAPLQGLILAGLLAAFAGLSRLSAGRFERLDRRLGDLSNPIYIWHGLVVLAGLAVGAEASAWSLPALALLTAATAILAHRLIDPGVDRLRDLVRGRRLRAPARAEPVRRASA